MLTLELAIEKVSSAKEPGCLRLTIVTQELEHSPEKIAMLHLLVGHTVTATFGKGDENEEKEVSSPDTCN